MESTCFEQWGISQMAKDRKKSFKKWLSAIADDMEHKYYDRVEDGLKTVEGTYDISDGHYICVECAPYGNKVEIFSTATDNQCCFPNIELAILKAMPNYNDVCDMVEKDRIEDRDIEDTNRSIATSYGWSYTGNSQFLFTND